MEKKNLLRLLVCAFAATLPLLAKVGADGKNAIPWHEIGAKAGEMCDGRGLEVAPVADGIRLNCDYQQLSATARRSGLWLSTTGADEAPGLFRVVAAALNGEKLLASGEIARHGDVVHYRRGRVVEEYSTSVDGIRQAFVINERPSGGDRLRLLLAVEGAPVTQTGESVSLVLSGISIAYHKLHVTDARGIKLVASLRVAGSDIEIVVDDSDALYPVRIDPTFSNANWSGMNTGVPGIGASFGDTVYAVAVDSKGVVYAGGEFGLAGGAVANNIAKWDGKAWRALDFNGVGGQVYALATSGTTLYVGGDFSTAGGLESCKNIAKWSNGSWSPLGDGIVGVVYALAVSGTTLYVGGDFSTAGGLESCKNIAKWSGSAWSALGGGVDGKVKAMVYHSGALYVGGDFEKVSETMVVNNVAKWSGNAWSALGGETKGVGGTVSALAATSNYLYVGGCFSSAGGNSANNIARWSWSGSAWSGLSSGVKGEVYSLAIYSTTMLYVGGDFIEAGGNSANHIVTWNGSAWGTMGEGADNTVRSMALSGSTLYAVGDFSDAGGEIVSRVARWNGTTKKWSSLGVGIDDAVNAVAIKNGKVYIGGDFRTAGNQGTAYLAEWYNGAWRSVGGGVDGPVYALLATETALYVGGEFAMAGAVAANNIAMWSEGAWQALGGGCGGDEYEGVYALAMDNDKLYAGGYFSEVDAKAVNHVAEWDGEEWNSLGAGIDVDGYVNAMAVHDGMLYVGGCFSEAGGESADNVAAWYGSAWQALGDGLAGGDDAEVFCLAVDSTGKLFAGGSFTASGTTSLNYIAQWYGGKWQSLGDGMNGAVNAIFVLGGSLFAGGDFSQSGVETVNSVAAWDGSEWVGVGDGIGGDGIGNHKTVYAMSAEGTVVYVGGDFFTVGGKSAVFAARLDLVIRPDISIVSDAGNLVISWPADIDENFVLEETAELGEATVWSACGVAVSNDNERKFVTITNPSGRRFFRLRLPQ